MAKNIVGTTLFPNFNFGSLFSKPTPNLVYNGGPLLANVEVFTIFWGDGWLSPANKITIQYINLFFEFILKGPITDQLKEYSVPNYQIGNGKLTGTMNIPHTFSFPFTSDATIRTLLTDNIGNGVLPQPNTNTLYFVYVQPGITVQQGFGISCLLFCGYHQTINNSIYYATIPYPNCYGCKPNNLSEKDSLTAVSSHELCEAITDPIPGAGWYDNASGEIGDICNFQTKTAPNSKYLIQTEWSNKNGVCR